MLTKRKWRAKCKVEALHCPHPPTLPLVKLPSQASQSCQRCKKNTHKPITSANEFACNWEYIWLQNHRFLFAIPLDMEFTVWKLYLGKGKWAGHYEYPLLDAQNKLFQMLFRGHIFTSTSPRHFFISLLPNHVCMASTHLIEEKEISHGHFTDILMQVLLTAP